MQVPAHLRYTQWSIMLHIIDNCFLSCYCLWQISQIQTCLCVVMGPGFVSTSPVFVRSSARHPADPHGRLVKKRLIGPTTPPLVECVVWSSSQIISDNIALTTADIPSTINTHYIKLQMGKVHINNIKHITIANMYIPPRDSTSTHYKTVDTDIQHHVLTGDVNAHYTL